MARSLQGPGRDNETDPLVALARQVADLRRQTSDAVAQVLRTAGLRAEPGRLVVEGDLSVPSGKITLAGVDQDLATAMATLADLADHEVDTGSNWATTSGFALPAAWTEYASCSLVVPDGYGIIQFDAIGTLYAKNTTATTQYLMARIYRQINGAGTIFNSVIGQATVPAGYVSTAMVPYKWSEAATPGDVHRFWIVGWAGGGWSADAGNTSRLEVSALFTR